MPRPVGANRLLVAVLLLCGWASPVVAQTEAQTNLQITSKILVAPLLSVIADTLAAPQALVIAGTTTDPLTSWLTQNLLESCLEENYLVYSTVTDLTVPFLQVELSAGQLDIEYTPAGKKWLFFSRGYRRSVTGSVHLSIGNQEEQVLFSRQISGRFSDTIRKDFVAAAEQEMYPFTAGNKKESRFREQWLEPIVISATTISVVVLFFLLRSSS